MNLEDLINSGALSLSLFEELYAQYKINPSSVDPSWREVFSELDIASYSKAPSVSSSLEAPTLLPANTSGQSVLYYPRVSIENDAHCRIYQLIDAYRKYGHLMAKVDPIALSCPAEPNELKIETYGFSKQDLSTHYPSCGLFDTETAPLLEILNALKSIYCNYIGLEYMRIDDKELRVWIQGHIEPKRFRVNLSIEQKRMILHYLNKSELFELFLHTKYVGQKRFSIEGGETLIPMLASLIDYGALHGSDEFYIGMSHRGRLNVLANLLNKSYADIFNEFEEGYFPASVEGSGDVKYHKGFFSEVKTIHGHPVKLTVTPNPSHLESVGPVVEGQVKARQILRHDEIKKDKVVPILIHGDGAIAGQGVVYETLQLSKLEGYSTGGTIHIVINNQIGFTTVPKDARSTQYCTDIAHTFGAPVFHVNSEDPEGCVHAVNLAMEIRQKFHCDVFIDLNCYRKYGHNEGDEPAFTQPLEYQLIRKKVPVRELYRDFLISQGVMEKSLAETLESEFKTALHEALNAKKIAPKGLTAEEQAVVVSKNDSIFTPVQTGVSRKLLKEIGERFCHVPEGFAIHPKLAILNKERLSMLQEGDGARPVDWGMGELLAYGSLLWEGTSVRLSGQDCCRGTFSHRHAMLMDQIKEQEYVPLDHLKADQGRFDVYNSSLSEYAVLGFEFGYSIANPQALVLWEAQFGDFANGAQIIFDQYIATAEQKWMQKFPLTVLLPHGFEGQGPEHSSARIERFLTLGGDHNMQIVNPTTPAQLFHLLRRQIIRQVKKPLIIFTPKGLLRLPACSSKLDEFTSGSFKEILSDPDAPARVIRLVLCSGRIYYDLIAEREKTQTQHMMIVRIEQLYPLDVETLKAIISKCSVLKECIWAQEEPSNMGAWNFIRPILQDILPKEIELSYVGRTRSASPAVGSHAVHKKEHTAIMKALFEKEQTNLDIAAGLRA